MDYKYLYYKHFHYSYKQAAYYSFCYVLLQAGYDIQNKSLPTSLVWLHFPEPYPHKMGEYNGGVQSNGCFAKPI